MMGPIYSIRNVAFCSVVLLILQSGQSACAGPCWRNPCRGSTVCIPNVAEFGHYQTVWREWPGKPEPDRAFPQSIGTEVIPTPQGREQLPLPEAGEVPDVGMPPAEPSITDGLLMPETTLPLDPLSPGNFPDELPDLTPDGPEPMIPQEAPPVLPADPATSSPSEPPPLEPPTDEPAPTIPNAGTALPKVGPPLTANEPVDAAKNRPAELPDAAVELAKDIAVDPPRAMDPLAEGPTDLQEPEPAEVPDLKSQAKQPGPKTLQANWMAALHPKFRGDVSRVAASSSMIGSSGTGAHHAAVVPQPTLPTEEQVSLLETEPLADHAEDMAQSGSSLVALDGFCPVELVTSERWVRGDPRLTVEHRGQTYLFADAKQRKRFRADPDRYVPRYAGYDPVLKVDEKRRVRGQTDYCVLYEGRLYAFSSSATLARFQENPGRYTSVSAAGK